MRRVILGEEDQVYFLHIPKTGGTSLFYLLYTYLPDEERPHYTYVCFSIRRIVCPSSA